MIAVNLGNSLIIWKDWKTINHIKYTRFICVRIFGNSFLLDFFIDYSSCNNAETTGNEKDKGEGYSLYSRVDLSKSFAQLSFPQPLLLQDRGGNRGLGVTAKTSIMAFTQFGPLQGEQILMKDIPDDFEMKELWQVRIK